MMTSALRACPERAKRFQPRAILDNILEVFDFANTAAAQSAADPTSKM